MMKFMMSVNDDTYNWLLEKSEKRGQSIQEFLRNIIADIQEAQDVSTPQQ